MVIPYDILNTFPPEREKALRSIERFAMFEVFFYRSSLWHHKLRVYLMVNALAPIIVERLPDCDINKARIMALVHDDAEIITGDIQLGHKEIMSNAELKKIHDGEAAAIEQLTQRYPELIGGYVYKELLTHALHKDCIEAQVYSYADKLDAYCETLHELFGGNLSALRSTIDYTNRLNRFGETFPQLKPLLTEKESPFINLSLRTDYLHITREMYAQLNTPHTRESIQRDTDLPFYNAWKKLVIKGLGEEGMTILTTQKEHF